MRFLNPALQTPQRQAELRQAWAQQRNLRLCDLLLEDTAQQLLAALRDEPFDAASAPPDRFAYQYWKRTWSPGAVESPLLESFARWMATDFISWVASWTGASVLPHPSAEVSATLFGYGCYLDLHNDWGHNRALAFVIGLTPKSWPAEEGGHLTFCTADNHTIAVSQRREPGWNTLDLFDVTGQDAFHCVPILTTARERRVVSGWLYSPAP